MRSKFGLSLAAAAVMLPLFAFAAKNSTNVDIPEKVVVNGKQLQPGSYKVEWSGTAPNVEVSILQGHKTVVETPARLVATNVLYPRGAVVTHQNSDGTSTLDQIQFKNMELDLTDGSQGQTSGTMNR